MPGKEFQATLTKQDLVSLSGSFPNFQQAPLSFLHRSPLLKGGGGGGRHGSLSYFCHIQRLKSTKEIIINHKGTRMVVNGEDYTGCKPQS